MMPFTPKPFSHTAKSKLIFFIATQQDNYINLIIDEKVAEV